MSGQLGLAMLACAALMMVLTGLSAWSVLICVSVVFGLIGVMSDIFSANLMMALPGRLQGLLESDLLQALPLYVLMGVLLNRLPLAASLFVCSKRIFSRFGGAGPLAGLSLGILLSPMNGSVGSSVAMLSRTVFPQLRREHVSAEQGAAIVCVASTLGVVIPPSLVLILLGDAMLRAHTEAINVTHLATRIINTQDVFRGALIPAGILVVLCLLIAWFSNRNDPSVDREKPTFKQWIIGLTTAAVILLLLGGVVIGYFFPVEAAATGGFLLLLFGVATRTLSRTVLTEVLSETMAISGALFALLVAATSFTLVLRAYETDRWIANWLLGLSGGPMQVLALVVAMLLVCAFVLDAFEMIFVVIPILLPPLLISVPDATWVAVITLMILQTSFILPPFGYAVLMIGNRIIPPVKTRPLSVALLPFVAAQITVLMLVLNFPSLVWHPSESESAVATVPEALQGDDLSRLLGQQSEAQKDTSAQ